jgi:hypothetical protein
VSGPAPDAAAAAPTSGTGGDGFVASALGGPGDVVPAPDAAATPPPAAASTVAGLEQLPVLGSLGSITDGPSAAREVLSTGAGRSLLAVGLLLGALGVFLLVHRRSDRTDTKLAAARSGPDVARFR